MGKSHIAQVISALEYWRFQNHHHYKDIPEAQVSLWNDNCIRTLEACSKHNEPKWIENSQALKAAGSSSGMFGPSLVPLLLTPIAKECLCSTSCNLHGRGSIAGPSTRPRRHMRSWPITWSGMCVGPSTNQARQKPRRARRCAVWSAPEIEACLACEACAFLGRAFRSCCRGLLSNEFGGRVAKLDGLEKLRRV